MSECTKCHGTGNATCSKCNGEKKVKCNECDGSGKETSICPVCNKGKVEKTRWINCSKCHGSGQLTYNTKCPHCHAVYNGDAKTCPDCECILLPLPDACYECDGRGQIEEKYYEICPNCHGEWRKPAGPCEKCNGTGKVICASCAGTGKEECCLCKGSGSIDVEAMCKQLIDISDPSPEIRKGKITEDMVRAIQDAADKGVGSATVVMGLLHDTGLKINGKAVVERNDKKAMEYYRKGAEAGDSIAQGNYGIRLAEKENKEVGAQWLVKAGENGNIESLWLLAINGYIYGEYGRDRDLVKSLECLKAILNAKDKDSWWEGYISTAKGYVKFLPSIINNDSKAMLALAEWMRSSGEFEASADGHDFVYWTEQAAKAGNIDAMMKVAKWYWDGNEKSKANEWYGKAESQGDAGTLMELGDRLRTGDGIAKDPRLAFVYLYRAAEQGNIVAIRKLGVMYYDGEYVEKNQEHSLDLFVRAAKSGNSRALYSVGMYYLNQQKDQAEAKRLLQLAAEKGSDAAKEALGKIPFSVKASTKMPSGIKGVPDKSPLPKFLKKDYEQAAAGQSAVDKKSKGSSSKKRWKFVVLGLLFGYFGVHLAYAKRWFLFLLLWAAFITGGTMSGGKGEPDKPVADTGTVQVAPPTDRSKKDEGGKKEADNPVSGIGFAVWGLLWIGGTLFIKKDGKGNRM